MSRVLHVDTARGWRGGQNQVLLTALGMAARGHEVAVACRAEGELLAPRPRRPDSRCGRCPFGAISGLPRWARCLRPARPFVPTWCSSTTRTRSPPGSSPAGWPGGARAGGGAARRLPAARAAVPGQVRGLRAGDRGERGHPRRAARGPRLPEERLRARSRRRARPRAPTGRPRGPARAGGAGGRARRGQRGGARRSQGPRDPAARRGPGGEGARPDARFVVAGEGEERAALLELRARAGPRRARDLRGLPRRPRLPGARLRRVLPLLAPGGPGHQPAGRHGLRPAHRGHRRGRHPRRGGGRRHGPPRARAQPEALADALLALLADPAARAAMGAAGRQRFLERVHRRSHGRGTLRVFEELGG